MHVDITPKLTSYILAPDPKLKYNTYEVSMSSTKESDKFDHYSFHLEQTFLMPFNYISI